MPMPPQLRRVSPTVWEIPITYKDGMRVPVRIIATESLLGGMEAGLFDQAANVACLPGILNYSYCMPDGHWGYGFPIGGVAAMDPSIGVISPGGICHLEAIVRGEQIDAARHRLLVDVKAVTLHCLQVKFCDNVWKATLVLDV